MTGFDLDAVIAIPLEGRGASTSSVRAQSATDARSIALIPNPASDRLEVRLGNAIRLRIIDGLGVVVLHQDIAAGASRVSVDTRSWSTGTYHVELISERGARSIAMLQIVR